MSMVVLILLMAILLPGAVQDTMYGQSPRVVHPTIHDESWETGFPVADEILRHRRDESGHLLVPSANGGELDAQRAKAIEKRDPALLPFCTKADFVHRSNPVPARSMEPWDHHGQLGCRLAPPRPDQIVPGPPSGGAYRR